MDTHALFAQATIALKAKRTDEARKLLAEVIRLNPRHEDAWLALASVLTDMRQAIDCLNRVLAINPNNATAQEWLVFAQQEMARQEVIKEMAAEPTASAALPPQPDGSDEPRPVPRLGEYLLDYKFISQEQLTAALAAQSAAVNAGFARRLGDILVEQGSLTEDRLNFALREQHRSFYSLFDD
jgi:tetratricopeptide (TPR) repeat protein